MTNPTFTARNVIDLIAVAPHVLGFRPQDDIVLMAFGSPAGPFHARVDLPDVADDQHEVTELLVGAAVRNQVDCAAVLIYSTDAELSRLQGRLLVDRLTAAGIGVIDVARVEPDRYFLPLEDDAQGTPYDISGHPFTAQRVFEGAVVEASREALVDTLVGTDEDDRDEVGRAAAGWDAPAPADAQWLTHCVRAQVRSGHGGGPRLDAVDAGRLLGLCQSVRLRDLAWSEMTRANATAQVELWRDLVRRAPDGLLPPAASLLGFAAWLAGDGALAWCALDRCAEVDPDYSMAHCIADLLLGAVPPSVWADMRDDAVG